MAEDNKPQGNEGGEGQQTEPQKEVVSYAKYKRETDEYQEQVKVVNAKAADIYRYMNFDQIAEFNELAETVTV